MIQAIIFDMDGLLIDSEPLWQEAEKRVFQKIGITLSTEDTTQTTGLRVDEVVEYWFTRFPWDEKKYSKNQVDKDIVEEVKQLIKEKGEAKKGVGEILQFLQAKNLPMAIASSSEYSIINCVVEKLGISQYFDCIYSAEEEKYGKPHPGVYLSACEKLGVNPENTITFEDSLNGVLSAKSAKIKCIAIPEEINKNNPKFVIADIVLNSLQDLGQEQWSDLNN